MKSRNLTLILFFVLALLGIGAYYFSKNSSETSSQIDIRDRKFAVEDRSSIHKILIGRRDGKSFVFEKKAGKWFVNESYLVHPNVMDNLLDALTRLELKYIPPRSAYDNMMNAIGRLGIKVEVYDNTGKNLKSYQVGGTTGGELGTVFLMDGYFQPYVMKMKNFEGSLRGRFLFDNVDQIRDRTVFGYLEEEIAEISIHYPKTNNESFVLKLNQDKFELEPYFKDGYVINAPIKSGTIQAFVRAFQDVDAEAYENQHPLRDSISTLVPLAEISVKDRKGEIRSVRLHSLIDIYNQDINTRGVDQDRRVERYFADCSWGDFMIVQDLLFRKVLWRYEEFY